MSRRVTIGLAVLCALAGGVLAWTVVLGRTTHPPSRHAIAALQDTVRIGWTDHHTAVLRASNDLDALAALGYVHGMKRPWTLTVWRRTALGHLSATFGNGLVPIDRHSRRLGFAHNAHRAYDRLPPSVQKSLRAYTRGLNAALQSKRVRRRPPFVFFDLRPRPWQPWHSLAIERLLAWTGTASPSEDGSEPPAFRRADSRLRRWLHLHGRTRSIAWAARSPSDTARTALFGRHVLGATARPVIQEVALQRPEASSLTMGTVPGTLLFPTGTTGPRAWTYLLSSPAQLEKAAIDTSRVQTRHERIRTRGGDEHLISAQRYEGHLLIDAVPPDSAWLLRWPGLRAASDVSQWMGAAGLRPSPPPRDSVFHLFAGAGLTVDSAGGWTVQGQPSVVQRNPGTILVGRSRWARHQADALRAQRDEGPIAPARWSRSDSSTWAAALLPRLLEDLSSLSGAAPALDDALSYLRNWAYIYEPSSIGAVVFEAWMRRYRAEIGRLPTQADSAFFAGPRRRQTFRRAVRRLADQYGTDVRRWRWERVAPSRRYFPVWAADSLVAADLSPLRSTRFAPLDRPGRGHVSTLAGGPTLVDPLPLGPAPTQWNGWMWSSTSTLHVRRLRFDPSAFFARSLLSRDLPAAVPVEAPTPRTTTLVPGAQ